MGHVIVTIETEKHICSFEAMSDADSEDLEDEGPNLGVSQLLEYACCG